MRAATINEIRQSLKQLDQKTLIEICQRLSRYKKENKELLSFLLYEADDLPHYIQSVKEELDLQFADVNINSVYFAKKGIRKALRIANKYIRYAADKTVEAEILLHYCTNFQGLKIAWRKSTLLTNIYQSQLKKIGAAINSMHEDLQYEYSRSLQRLQD